MKKKRINAILTILFAVVVFGISGHDTAYAAIEDCNGTTVAVINQKDCEGDPGNLLQDACAGSGLTGTPSYRADGFKGRANACRLERCCCSQTAQPGWPTSCLGPVAPTPAPAAPTPAPAAPPTEQATCASGGGIYASNALSGAYASKTCEQYCSTVKGTGRLMPLGGSGNKNCCCKASGGTTSSTPGSFTAVPGAATPVRTGPYAHINEATFENPLKGAGDADIRVIVGNGIRYVLGIIGSVALVIFLYGGIQWMVAMGDDNKIKKGLDTMIWTGLGLVIIFGSYIAVQFLLTSLLGS